jgi:hypothetical protein
MGMKFEWSLQRVRKQSSSLLSEVWREAVVDDLAKGSEVCTSWSVDSLHLHGLVVFETQVLMIIQTSMSLQRSLVASEYRPRMSIADDHLTTLRLLRLWVCLRVRLPTTLP